MVLEENPVNDIEALEDENHKLKVALSRATEENKRYRVNKARLEGELLRADDKIDILLFELEQTPGKRCYMYAAFLMLPRLCRCVICRVFLSPTTYDVCKTGNKCTAFSFHVIEYMLTDKRAKQSILPSLHQVT